MNLPEQAKLKEIYGETEKCGARFEILADNFEKIYHALHRIKKSINN